MMRRRWILSLITILGVCIPLCAVLALWIADSSSQPTNRGFLRSVIGETKTRLVLRETSGTVNERKEAEQNLARRGLEVYPSFSTTDLPITIDGITHNIDAEIRDWKSDLFRSAFTVTDGTLPSGDGDIFVTPGAAKEFGISVGSRVTLKQSGKDLVVAGIGTIPTDGRTSSTFFILPQDVEDFTITGKIGWLTPSDISPHTASQLQKSGFLVHSPQRLIERSNVTLVNHHPLLLGGTFAVAFGAALICVRFLAARHNERSGRTLRSLGARRSELLRMNLVQAITPGVVGFLLAVFIMISARPLIAQPLADANGIEVPELELPVAGLAGLLGISVVMLAISAVIETKIVSRDATGGPDAPATALGREVSSARQVGARIFRTHGRRTQLLAFLSAVLTAIPLVLGVFMMGLDKANQEWALQGVRPGTYQLVLRGKAPSSELLKEWTDITGAQPAVISHLVSQPDALDLLQLNDWCTAVVLEDDAAYELWSGTPMADEARDVLARGQALSATDECVGRLEIPDSAATVTLESTKANEADVYTEAIGKVAIGPEAVTALSLWKAPTLLLGTTAKPMTPDMTAQLQRTVENAGFSGADLRFSEVVKFDAPAVIVAIVAELVGLGIIVAITSTLSVRIDDAVTHRLLANLGMSRRQLARVVIWAASVPIAVGAAVGVIVGLAGGALLSQSLSGKIAFGAWMAFPLLSVLASIVTASGVAARST